jgi:hypothetical protein
MLFEEHKSFLRILFLIFRVLSFGSLSFSLSAITFTAPLAYTTGIRSNRVLIGDFNRDGRPDLVAGGLDASGQTGEIEILPGKGDGTFGSPVMGRSGCPSSM